MGSKKQHARWSVEDRSKVRVLLECPPAASPTIVAGALEREGYAVQVCEGPTEHRCDLLDDGVCGLVDGADVVVNLLAGDATGREVLRATTEVRRPPAVVVELTARQAEALAAESGGLVEPPAAVVADAPVTRQALVDAIDEALAAHGRPVPVWGDGFT